MTDKIKPTPYQAKKGPFAKLLASIKELVEPTLPIEDRRIGGRLTCSYQTSYVSEYEETGHCEVVDVSRRGLQIKTEVRLARGLRVALKAPEELEQDIFGSIMANVMWTRKGADKRYLSGLKLPPGIEDEETWLESILAKAGYRDDGSQRRKFVRAESEISGHIDLEGQVPFDVMVLNLGMGGALIQSGQAIKTDSPFKLHLGPHGDLPAIEILGTILREMTSTEDDLRLYSSRFAPLEKRRHNLLQEYILALLKKG